MFSMLQYSSLPFTFSFMSFSSFPPLLSFSVFSSFLLSPAAQVQMVPVWPWTAKTLTSGNPQMHTKTQTCIETNMSIHMLAHNLQRTDKLSTGHIGFHTIYTQTCTVYNTMRENAIQRGSMSACVIVNMCESFFSRLPFNWMPCKF